MQDELPEAVAGVRWRRGRAEDAEPFFALILAIDAVDDPDHPLPRGEFDAMLVQSVLTEHLVFAEHDDAFVAFAWRRRPGGGPVRLIGGVHPAARGRGLGRALLPWQIHDALRTERDATTATVRQAARSDVDGLATRLGFQPERMLLALRHVLGDRSTGFRGGALTRALSGSPGGKRPWCPEAPAVRSTGGIGHHGGVDEAERVRVRLDLAYDGTDFAGWATQPGQRTVQGELEAALLTLTRRAGSAAPRLTVAGRTDAGVHATGQVAHVDLTHEQLATAVRRHTTEGDPEDLAARLTGLLADRGDVVVQRAAIAPAGFDARYAAAFRRYRYRIADRLAARDPLQRRRTLHHPRELDDGAMQESAHALPGLHDFAAYCRPREGATTIRELHAFTWRRDDEGVLVAEVVADAFCHGMVRALVGAGIAVGLGRLAPARVGGMLLTPIRGAGFAVAPAHGLTLVEVGYPAGDRLAEQAQRARARRGSEES